MPTRTRQPRHRLYDDLAPLWPALSPREHDAGDAAIILRLMRQRLRPAMRQSQGAPPRPTLLDLGCGGGHLLSHLTPYCDVVGVDLAPRMLALSRTLNPDAEHVRGDMRRIRLRRRFDAVILHDACNYLLTPADLLAAMRTAAAHLRTGGLLILMPDDVAETFTDHARASDAARTPTHDLAVLTHIAAAPRSARAAGRGAELSMLLLLHDRAAGTLDIVDERHRLGLFARSIWERSLCKAGFEDVAYLAPGAHRPGPAFAATRIGAATPTARPAPAKPPRQTPT